MNRIPSYFTRYALKYISCCQCIFLNVIHLKVAMKSKRIWQNSLGGDMIKNNTGNKERSIKSMQRDKNSVRQQIYPFEALSRCFYFDKNTTFNCLKF